MVLKADSLQSLNLQFLVLPLSGRQVFFSPSSLLGRYIIKSSLRSQSLFLCLKNHWVVCYWQGWKAYQKSDAVGMLWRHCSAASPAWRSRSWITLSVSGTRNINGLHLNYPRIGRPFPYGPQDCRPKDYPLWLFFQHPVLWIEWRHFQMA